MAIDPVFLTVASSALVAAIYKLVSDKRVKGRDSRINELQNENETKDAAIHGLRCLAIRKGATQDECDAAERELQRQKSAAASKEEK